MKTITHDERELRIIINGLFHNVLHSAASWAPPPALLRMIRDSAACRNSDPETSHLIAINATDFMNEHVGMSQAASQARRLLDSADLDKDQYRRTQNWVRKVQIRHQMTLNLVPIDWMHAHHHWA